MGSSPTTQAADQTKPFRLARWRISAVVAAGILVAACQAGGAGAPPATVDPTAPVGSASPALSASATPSATAPAASPTGSATAASPSAGTAVDPRADGLDVAFGEFAITLEAEVIRPGPVTLIVHNAGQMTHGLEMKIESSGSGSGSGRDRKKIETRTFNSGETLRVEADLSPGVYEIECYVDGHASKGMRTSLEVRADAPLTTADPGTTASGTTRIVQFAFVPVSLDVPAGTSVSWANDDPTPHTVTADSGAFDSKQLDPGATFSVVLDTPGSFAYHCEIHPTMVGTVLVR